MPDGTANPCGDNNDQSPLGFNQIRMNNDLLSDADVGHCIFRTERYYNPITPGRHPQIFRGYHRGLKIARNQGSTRVSLIPSAKGEGDE